MSMPSSENREIRRAHRFHTSDVYVKYTATSSIYHGDPGAGKPTQRLFPVKVLDSATKKARIILVPGVSGESLRCTRRRSFIHEVLAFLGYETTLGILGNGISPRLVDYLEAGGVQLAGTSLGARTAEEYLAVYSDLPFFGLFGSLGWPGRLGVQDAVPVLDGQEGFLSGNPFVAQGKVDFFAHDAWEAERKQTYTRFEVKDTAEQFAPLLANNVMAQKLLSLQEYPEFVSNLESAIRYNNEHIGKSFVLSVKDEFDVPGTFNHGDGAGALLRELESTFNIEAAKSDAWKTRVETIKKRISGLFRRQNMYSKEGMIPLGTELLTRLSLMPGPGDDNLMELAYHAYAEVFLAHPTIGGTSGGYGFVDNKTMVLHNGEWCDFATVSRADDFWTWLDDNRDKVRESIARFETYIVPTA